MYKRQEEHGPKNIAVIGSDSASAGELNIALRIRDLIEAGKSFQDIVEDIMVYREEMKTYFVLESLDTLSLIHI